ncbi:MAG: 50S ribosomal protein L4 [Patescibacteria group bacterium]|nr:50S ribosomal protein L4 [Patescibacteria group bacterium]
MPTVKKTATKKVVKKETVKKTAVKKPVVKETPARKASTSVAGGGLKQSVYDIKGKIVESISLPKEIFNVKINNQLMAQAVRVYLSNQRRGTVKTKSRGEVNKTTKKAYRQKGTGRARHGAMSAPIYVGGGVAFGPRPRDYSLSLPQKMKKASLFSALSSKLKDGEIKILTGLEKIQPKTKLMAQVIKSLNFESKSKVDNKLLLITANGADDVRQAGRNIKGLSILDAKQINTYEVLDNRGIILMKGALEVIENNFIKQNKLI